MVASPNCEFLPEMWNVQGENFYKELGAKNWPNLVAKSMGAIISGSLPKTL